MAAIGMAAIGMAAIGMAAEGRCAHAHGHDVMDMSTDAPDMMVPGEHMTTDGPLSSKSRTDLSCDTTAMLFKTSWLPH